MKYTVTQLFFQVIKWKSFKITAVWFFSCHHFGCFLSSSFGSGKISEWFLLVPSRNCWIGCINNFCKNKCFKFNTSYAIPIPYRCMYLKFDQPHISSLESGNLLQRFCPYPSSCATSNTFLNKDPPWDPRWTSDSCFSGGYQQTPPLWGMHPVEQIIKSNLFTGQRSHHSFLH